MCEYKRFSLGGDNSRPTYLHLHPEAKFSASIKVLN